MELGPRARVMVLFALNAVLNAGMLSRLAEVQRDLRLNESQFGWAIAALPLGVLFAMQVAPAAARRLGTRQLLLVSFALSAITPPVFGLLPDFTSLLLAMIGYGFITSLAGVAMNVEADVVARATGRPLMSKSHGAWSAAFMVTSAAGALAIRLGATPMQQFLAVMVFMLAGTVLFVAPMAEGARVTGRPPVRRIVLPDRMTLRIMGFGILSVIVEVIVRNWSIIYLRDTFGAADWIAALSLPAFIALQTLGRFLSDDVAARIGDVRLGRLLAAITLAGLLLLGLAGSTAMGLIACAVIGLGVSSSYPITVTAAARDRHRSQTEAVAAFIILQNLLAFAAPVVFGLAAEASSQRLALFLLLPVPVIAWVFARELGR